MSLLFNFSKVAERALNGRFRESEGNTLSLPDADSDAFGMFVVYMYEGKLRIFDYCKMGATSWVSVAYESLTDACLLLCRLYVLADFLECRYWFQIRSEILAQLDQVVKEASKMRKPTPILPDTLLEVLQTTGQQCRLRGRILKHLTRDFARMEHRPMREYMACIRKSPGEFMDVVFERVVGGFHWGQHGVGALDSWEHEEPERKEQAEEMDENPDFWFD